MHAEPRIAEESSARVGLRRIHIIINPAAGTDKPVLKLLNAAFKDTAIDWEVSVTKRAGDARRHAEEALAAGVDVVAVYGGDGTVMEAASALIGAGTPLGILPGGSANVMAAELGIPNDIAGACTLLGSPETVIRAIDVGQAGDDIFLTRLGIGLEGHVIEKTAREWKDRLGWLAYLISALPELRDPAIARYQIALDGRQIETEGLICVVANSGVISPNALLPGADVTYAPDISVTDGLLDVVVVRSRDLTSLLGVAARVVTGQGQAQALQRWRARQVTVVADPPQVIQCDGEILGETPVTARVLPGALRVLVPAPAEARLAEKD